MTRPGCFASRAFFWRMGSANCCASFPRICYSLTMDLFSTTADVQQTDESVAKIIRVIVPQRLFKSLDYKVYFDGELPLYSWADVPLGLKSTKKVPALIVAIDPEDAYSKVKEATLRLDVPPLSTEVAEFLLWAAAYTLAPVGEVLRAVLVKASLPEEPSPEIVLALTGMLPERSTPQRDIVLKTLTERALAMPELLETSGVGRSVVKGLIEQGCIAEMVAEEAPHPTTAIKKVTLNPDQLHAANEICKASDAHQFQPFLLDGVTGSGKTEVYFEVLERLLSSHTGQVLLLLPEIALTPQWLSRFESRFGFTPAVWHSSQAEGAKNKAWWDILSGKARVVVGARSALFLPYRQLDLIVVDEEHDSAYKQEDLFRYHGRDMAVVLAKKMKCPVVLASATPSLESWHNAQEGRYITLPLKSRYGAATLPDVELVDMTQNPPKGARHYMATQMIDALRETLEAGKQSIVYLNRRGHAPMCLCRDCGEKVECPSCSTTLTVHGGLLKCHHCAYSATYPERCTKCGSERILPYGPGTRQLMEELEEHFPEARIAVADSDALTTVRKMSELTDKMRRGEIDILVGTQMVAKGHDFPDVTLVGVVDTMLGNTQGDFRATEKAFQLLYQVSGRAGRGKDKGRVLIQTLDKNAKALEALVSGNRDSFYTSEITHRKQWDDPPFTRLTALFFSGAIENDVLYHARQIAEMMLKSAPANMRILGPSPMGLVRIKNRFRYMVLIKSATPSHGFIRDSLLSYKIPSSVRLDIDVDPLSML